MTALERMLYWFALVACVAIIGLQFCGCATWQTTAAKTVLGVESGVEAARVFLAEPCHPDKVRAAVDSCIAAKDRACAPLRRCEVATKALHSLETAVLIAKLAIEAGDEKKAAGCVAAALQAVGPVVRAVEVWK